MKYTQLLTLPTAGEEKKSVTFPLAIKNSDSRRILADVSVNLSSLLDSDFKYWQILSLVAPFNTTYYRFHLISP